MGVSKRIIPCLDVNGGRVVKGVRFVDIKDAGNPVELALRYRDEGADELVFLDITASAEKREILIDLVKAVAFDLDIPFTVGGGVWSFDDAQSVLQAGADKISLNSAIVSDKTLVERIAECFGRQCVVIAIDAAYRSDGGYEVFTHGGRRRTGLDAIEWAREVNARGAGEILLTSMDRDGTKLGFDLQLNRSIADAVSIPVIASGGAGNLIHFYEVFERGGVDAALAASIFHYGEYSINELKEFLYEKGVAVRR